MTDSMYCINSFSSLNIKSKANLSLIDEYKSIVASKDINVEFGWVKGHDDDALNNYVDLLTNLGSSEIELSVMDSDYKQENPTEAIC